jgi:hypothetical protein
MKSSEEMKKKNLSERGMKLKTLMTSTVINWLVRILSQLVNKLCIFQFDVASDFLGISFVVKTCIIGLSKGVVKYGHIRQVVA